MKFEQTNCEQNIDLIKIAFKFNFDYFFLPLTPFFHLYSQESQLSITWIEYYFKISF